jgi:hypothetical protein
MTRTIAAIFAVATLATGCSLAVSADEAGSDQPAAGGGDSQVHPEDDGMLREEAQALLGVAEADLGDRARVGRRGDEQMMLTEDYRVGRFTVELDDDGTGTFVVTTVTVELAEAPETFTS